MLKSLDKPLLEKTAQNQPKKTTILPWNKNRTLGWKKPFTLDEVAALKRRLRSEQRLRDLILLSLALDSMLRACDLLSLQIHHVQIPNGAIREFVCLRQKKTKEVVRFAIGEQTRKSLLQWISSQHLGAQDYIFPGRSKGTHFARRSYLTLVKEWAKTLGLPTEDYGTHSLRRTKPVIIYKRTKDVETVRLLLGQKNTASTSHYLGIDIDNALKVGLDVEL